MELSINAQFHDEIDEPSWTLASKTPARATRERLNLAFIETVSMFNSETPMVLTVTSGAPPKNGEIAPKVFFCRPETFRLDEPIMVNTAFWDQCMEGKGFADALVWLGELLDDEEDMEAQLKEWSLKWGFHCLNVFPE